ncbi:hypothetical protein GUITHDRAFT_111432 [Guillardia theta CCMP2712]|uniref:RWP-RK domain-containing protein n=2 Tax=Guillardia theta TaxID=55529 RepID=L1J2U3_GUITC|nr:hypothetical protein GUITHDRAFT_111432 [Guillardia theta CCMP2712]EKX42459.1 hypothetical protein GUITHDRAFT_111432 [Guillardia theta CCMP2712]|eukprot:XP_005829439.1 hypothetical protein GUITHDRAFT_111432 [Guillardia theta CCMP2712]
MQADSMTASMVKPEAGEMKPEAGETSTGSARASASMAMVCPRKRKDCTERWDEPVLLTRELLESYFDWPLAAVSKDLGICQTSIKKACRKLGIAKWPFKSPNPGPKRKHTRVSCNAQATCSFQPVKIEDEEHLQFVESSIFTQDEHEQAGHDEFYALDKYCARPLLQQTEAVPLTLLLPQAPGELTQHSSGGWMNDMEPENCWKPIDNETEAIVSLGELLFVSSGF